MPCDNISIGSRNGIKSVNEYMDLLYENKNTSSAEVEHEGLFTGAQAMNDSNGHYSSEAHAGAAIQDGNHFYFG